jgi:hypothetical protein
MLLEKEGLNYLRNYIESRINNIRKITSKGYVNSYDIFNDTDYYNLSKIAILLLQPDQNFLDKLDKLNDSSERNELINNLGKSFIEQYEAFESFSHLSTDIQSRNEILNYYKPKISVKDKREILENALQIEHLQNLILIYLILDLYNTENKEHDDLYYELEGQLN